MTRYVIQPGTDSGLVDWMIDLTKRVNALEAVHSEAPTDRRTLALHDLRYLLTFPHLGAWGMDALRDTLTTIVPDLIVHNRG